MSRIIEIDDLNRSELDVYVRLTGAQLRSRLEPERGIFIAESPTVISVALDAGCTPISLLTDKRLLSGGIVELAERCGDIPIYTAERELLTEITGFELTRGALAAMKRPPAKSAEDILSTAKRIAVLEGITDSTNIGAIFRSAAALGIDAVLLTPACSNPLYRRSARVSMGTVFQVPWTYLEADWITQLRELGFKTAAMALRVDSLTIDDPELAKQEKLAIVLGTEGEGLADSTIANCDYTVLIPMYHGVDSLNVAAASAVAFWELCRK